jgi:porphobilinogen synthase
MPLFVRPGKNIRAAIPSIPGQFQLSIDQLVKESQELADQRVPAVLLFGTNQPKDEKATHAYAKDGIVQQAIQAIKAHAPQLLVMTDVCVCAYTSHGHCGILKGYGAGSKGRGASKSKAKKPAASKAGATHQQKETGRVQIDQAATLELLAKTALSHAQAGADLVAPSDMMDGRVGAIRRALDQAGFGHLPIMSYAAKFASNLYAPFREAVNSSPSFGDRKSYQLDIANSDEAIREAELDLEEGADILLVKPALAYLDIIYRIKQRFGCPVAAFNVSGEYGMIKAAVARGWLIERPTWLEILTSLRRAGADLIVTYAAKDAAKLLQER